MDYVWFASIAARIALLIRLLWLRSWRDWPALVTLISTSIARSLLLVCFKVNTKAYGDAWMISAPILMLAQIWAAFEVFGHICQEFPGIGRFARRVLAGITLAGFAISALVLFWEAGPAYSHSRLAGIMMTMTVLTRYVSTAIAVGLISGWLFFLPYPSFRRRSITINLWMLIAWMTIFASSFWIFNIGDRAQRQMASNFLVGADIVCCLVWALLVRRHTERPLVVVTDKEIDELDSLKRAHDANLDRLDTAVKRLRGRD